MAAQARSAAIYARHRATPRPVAFVSWDRDDQVVVLIRQEETGGHVTLHERVDEPLLLTLSMNEKPEGTWDAETVAIARELGYANPEKHAHYVSQQPIRFVHGFEGYPLVGWLVFLERATDKSKYAKHPRLDLKAPSDPFRLQVILSTPDLPLVNTEPTEPSVQTPLGDLYFRCEEP